MIYPVSSISPLEPYKHQHHPKLPGDGTGGGKLADEGAGDGKFKVPTLREVARTAPYMHDGSLKTLEDVVDYYDLGGNANPYPRDDRELWRVPVEGGKAERIGVHTGGGQQFSPDGRRLFFWENNSQGGEVWVLENFLPKEARQNRP